MGNTVGSCRGYMQGALAIFVIIFLVALFVAIIDWQIGGTSCFMMLNGCTRIIMDIVLVVLALAGVLYLSYLVSNCKCEGPCGNGECKEDVAEVEE